VTTSTRPLLVRDLLWASDLAFLGGDDGNRTHDPLLAKQVL
jgi:hypothetical protein